MPENFTVDLIKNDQINLILQIRICFWAVMSNNLIRARVEPSNGCFYIFFYAPHKAGYSNLRHA